MQGGVSKTTYQERKNRPPIGCGVRGRRERRPECAVGVGGGPQHRALGAEPPSSPRVGVRTWNTSSEDPFKSRLSASSPPSLVPTIQPPAPASRARDLSLSGTRVGTADPRAEDGHGSSTSPAPFSTTIDLSAHSPEELSVTPAPGEGRGAQERRTLPLAPGPGLSGGLFGLGYTISPFNSAGGRGAATVSPFPPPARAPWRVSTCCGKVAGKRQGAIGTGATGTGPAALGHLRAGRWRRAGDCALRSRVRRDRGGRSPPRPRAGRRGGRRRPARAHPPVWGPCGARWPPTCPRCAVTCFALPSAIAIAAPVAVAASSQLRHGAR